MREILDYKFIQNILEEYEELNIYDLKKCINISLTEYFHAKEAFFVRDKIYIKLQNNFQVMARNTISRNRLKELVRKNFVLLNALKTTMNKPQSVFQKQEVIFYGLLNTINDNFALYDVYFNSKKLENIKAIVHTSQNNEKIEKMKKEFTSITINPFSMKKIENIFVFDAEVLNESIIKHEIATIFKEINKNLTKKLKFKVKYIDYNKNKAIIQINKKILGKVVETLKSKFKEKTNMELSLFFENA